jgi:alginate O-acetyltransferase complex protein AlgI
MVFSSTFFLFSFLPAVIICYYAQRLLVPTRLRNATLLFFSYLFYLYGAAGFLLILIMSTFADYLLGLLIDHDARHKKLWLCLSVIFNLGLLAYFKYANFFVAELNSALVFFQYFPIDWKEVIFPIGISFFTFKKLSYIIDVYRGESPAMENIADFALYIAMFPQLIAGPIVRYSYIRSQLKDRRESWNNFYMGILRFCWGLAKKVMIANSCGQIADVIFNLDFRSPTLFLTLIWSCSIPKLPGSVRLPTPSKFISIFRPIPTWPSAWACCLVLKLRKISTVLTPP